MENNKQKVETKDENLWNQTISYGIPLKVYLPLIIVVLLATFTEMLPDNMVGGTAFLLVIAGFLVFIGDRIPIWKDWLGGGLILCLVVGGVMDFFEIIPEASYETISGFYHAPTNMLVWCIAALIAGSILSMPREYLVKALPLYVPALAGGLIFAYVITFIGGTLIGYGGFRAILTVVNPIQGGGLGAGAIPMSEIYAGATDMGFDQIFSMLIPAVVIGNIIAIVIGAVLNRLGQTYPNLSGDGLLMPKERWTPEGGIEEIKVKLTDKTIVQGWTIAVVLLVAGFLLEALIPIHYFALMIILTAAIKFANILPDEAEQSAGHFYQFIATGFYGPLLLGVGMVHFELDTLVETLTLQYLFLALLTVGGAGLGAALIGKLFKLYPIESALTGGLCMANMGGSGDIAVLAGAKRMELMPFAQIASRIGGAIMLLLGQLSISLLAQFL
ncbi:2-hydroxycarboxylate transporter family protein [Halarsenatibacter silvermanii]|uniref:Na+/citrate or Na+/malate symporter n=1 Tax=Halarsenatibacter silvermanii TaxID=321763 RepID=A0A1G9TG28_9FIRM|nr:2-hydroxycarboxylate transporter family protein [Halarsenatibacter silvermanii]SDM46095.1 Na+/citrate or Na+/malate symporter [Halarsenatibacter silvermanii]